MSINMTLVEATRYDVEIKGEVVLSTFDYKEAILFEAVAIAEHAWQSAYAHLNETGDQAFAETPAARRYRAASDAINHARRALESYNRNPVNWA